MEHPLAVDFVRWIVLLPLIGAAVNFLAGAWHCSTTLGKRAISLVGCGTVAAAFAIAVYAWVTMLAIGAGRSLHARRPVAVDSTSAR